MTDRNLDYVKILYNIKPLLSQNYKKIKRGDQRIYICCFNIQSNEERESSLYHLKNPKSNRMGIPKLPKFFLMYLLYKYKNKNGDDFMIFPFVEMNKDGNMENTVNLYIKNELSISDHSNMGYVEKDGDIYFFANVTHNVNFNNNRQQGNELETLSYCLIDEICNKRKFLNIDINHSVFSLFYQNPGLIHLTFKKQKQPIPVVGFYGVPKNKIALFLGLGGNIQHTSNTNPPFGHHASLWDFQNSFKTALWYTSNIERIQLEHRNDIDEYGRFKEYGVIIRYAAFLGRKSWHIMYNKNDPFYNMIKTLDISVDNLKKLEEYYQIQDKTNKEWPKIYDSLTMSPFKLKNIDTIYPNYRAIVLRKRSQEIPLSLYNPDPNQKLPLFWDRNFKYNIK